MDHCACDRSDGSFANAGVSDKDITPNREGFGRCISFSSRKRRREDFDARLLRVATPQRCCSTLCYDDVCATADVYGKAFAGGRGGVPTSEGAVLSIGGVDAGMLYGTGGRGQGSVLRTADDDTYFPNGEGAATPVSPASNVSLSQSTGVDTLCPEVLRSKNK